MGGVRSDFAPPGRENARERRRRTRRDNSILRESEALRHYAGGMSYDEIAAEMRCASSTAWELVQRGLKRRVEEDEEIVKLARARVDLHLGRLLEAWMPRALGKALDVDLQEIAPSEPAAKVVLGILDRYVEIWGVKPPTQLEVDLRDDRPAGPEAIANVMAVLARTAAKEKTIEGHLAGAGTDLHKARGGDERQLPPVIPLKERKT